jgi:hypothetical protein
MNLLHNITYKKKNKAQGCQKKKDTGYSEASSLCFIPWATYCDPYVRHVVPGLTLSASAV